MKYMLSGATFVPEVVSALHELPVEAVRHDEQLLRHPADAFMVVFRDLLESGIQTCRDRQVALATSADAAQANDVDLRLRRSLRGLHTCLADYINACRTIILATSAHAAATKAGRSFRAATNPYYDHVLTIDNFIKHQQRTLRTVYARWSEGQIIGYQVEGVLHAGTVGAEPKIHRYPGTAFSLNRSLKFHACHIYLMSAALQTTLKLPKPKEHKVFTELARLASTFLALVADIPPFFFPDEQKLPVPLVKRSTDSSFILEYPSSAKPANRRPHVMNMNFRFYPSVNTPSVEVPYLGLNRPWER